MYEIITKDADEAAFIWMQPGAEFIGTEIKNGLHRLIVWFKFSLRMTKEEYDSLMNDYCNGKTLVDPKAYSAKRQEIKHIIKRSLFSDGDHKYFKN